MFWLDSGAGATAMLGVGSPALGTPAAPVRKRCARNWRVAVPDADGGAPPFRSGWSAGSATSCGARRWASRWRATSRYPDAAFLRVDRAVAFDARRPAELLALGDGWRRARRVAGDDRRASSCAADRPLLDLPAGAPVRWHDADAYLATSRACQAAIREGEAYQLCLTTEASVDGAVRPGRLLPRAARAEPQPPRRAAPGRRRAC